MQLLATHNLSVHYLTITIGTAGQRQSLSDTYIWGQCEHSNPWFFNIRGSRVQCQYHVWPSTLTSLLTQNLLSEQGANQMLSPLHLLWGISSPWEMSKCPTWVCWEYILRPVCLFVDGIYCCIRQKICTSLCTMCVLWILECLLGLFFVSKIYCSRFYVNFYLLDLHTCRQNLSLNWMWFLSKCFCDGFSAIKNLLSLLQLWNFVALWTM